MNDAPTPKQVIEAFRQALQGIADEATQRIKDALDILAAAARPAPPPLTDESGGNDD